MQTITTIKLCTFILSMQASIFSCSTAFLAWEMLAVLLLAMPSFMVLLWRQTDARGGGDSVNVTLNQHPPWRQLYPDGAATLLQPHPHPFLFTQWNLEGPILFVHLLSEEAALWASAGQRFVIFQPALMHDCFSSFVTLLFRPTGGGGEVSKEWRAGRD